MSPPVRCRTVLHAAVLAAALTARLAVPPAHAHSPCDPTDNDRAEASRVLAGLTREIDVMEATIVEALRLQTGQLSGYAAQSAKAVTGALDAQTKLQAQIAREVEETRAMRARRPTDSGCFVISSLQVGIQFTAWSGFWGQRHSYVECFGPKLNLRGAGATHLSITNWSL